ncbi:MAG: hypothetical protein IJB31_02805 [Akkermansia sp.]|nr:hypothetical protein [Akkermansia sp.]
MSTSRSISLKGWVFWSILIAGIWFAGKSFFSEADTAVFDFIGHMNGWQKQEHAQLRIPGKELKMETVLNEKRTLICPAVGKVELSDTTAQNCFAALPLQTQDMAVILRYLSQAGARSVGVSAPFVWQEEPGDMARQMFCQALQGFDSAVIGLRGRTAAQADFTPVALRSISIPADQVEGDPTGLPAANKPYPNGLAASPDALKVTWAPDWLDDEPLTQKPSSLAEISYPLLMRWNGETIPTLPLRLALMHLGLTPADVGVRLGRDIRFGGRSLPLDEHGRTRITHAITTDIPLADVVGGKSEQVKTLGDKPCIVIAQPHEGGENAERLQLLAATTSQLIGKEKIEYTKTARPCGGRVLEPAQVQTNVWIPAIATACIALALLILPWLPGILRFLIILGSLAALYWQTSICVANGVWFSVTTASICWACWAVALLVLRPRERGYFRRRR